MEASGRGWLGPALAAHGQAHPRRAAVEGAAAGAVGSVLCQHATVAASPRGALPPGAGSVVAVHRLGGRQSKRAGPPPLLIVTPAGNGKGHRLTPSPFLNPMPSFFFKKKKKIKDSC